VDSFSQSSPFKFDYSKCQIWRVLAKMIIPSLTLQIFKPAFEFVFFFHIWSLFFLLQFVLFEIIYRIGFCFQLHSLLFFYLSILILIFFYCYLFYLKCFLKLIFLQFHSPLIFFLSNLILIILIVIFFLFNKFFILIFFLILFFNIKFIKNWVSWCSLDLEF
jgi:hypothetical protein